MYQILLTKIAGCFFFIFKMSQESAILNNLLRALTDNIGLMMGEGEGGKAKCFVAGASS